MSTSTTLNNGQLVLSSAMGGACAYYCTPLPVAGGVLFGLTHYVTSGIVNDLLKEGHTTIEKITRAIVLCFANFAAALAVTSALFTPLNLKTCMLLSGAYVGGIVGLAVLAFGVITVAHLIKNRNNAGDGIW